MVERPFRTEEQLLPRLRGDEEERPVRTAVEFDSGPEIRRRSNASIGSTTSFAASTVVLVQASTREEVLETVCERLVSEDAYRFAWIGTQEVVSDEVTPAAWAGTEDGYLDEVTVTVGGSDGRDGLRSGVCTELVLELPEDASIVEIQRMDDWDACPSQ